MKKLFLKNYARTFFFRSKMVLSPNSQQKAFSNTFLISMKIKKEKDVNTLPGMAVCEVLAGSFFNAFLNCAIPKTTFRIFIHRK